MRFFFSCEKKIFRTLSLLFCNILYPKTKKGGFRGSKIDRFCFREIPLFRKEAWGNPILSD